MSGEYRIVVLSAAGVKRGELTSHMGGDGYLWLSYRREVNAPGLIRFGLDADSTAVNLFEQDGQVEVWRRDTRQGVPWTLEITGLYRRRTFEPDQEDESAGDIGDSNETCIITCPGVLHFLSRRVNAYYAGDTDRSSFENEDVENIMRAMVRYNCTADATTANRRIRTAAALPVSIEDNQERGGTITRGNSGANVLTELQELAALGSLDFDLVRTGDAAWVFRVYELLGTDRSTSSPPLSRENGTLNVLTADEDSTEAKTVAIAAGQGEGAARAFSVHTSDDYSADQDIETWVDARHVETTAELEHEGDQALREAAAVTRFEFDVLQAPGDLYGVHYTLGDLRTISYRGITLVQQVVAVDVELDQDGDEAISIQMAVRP